MPYSRRRFSFGAREQIARLAEESLSLFGYAVYRVSAAAGIPSLKGLLIAVWQGMSPSPSAAQTPPWVAQAARLTPGGVANQLVGIGAAMAAPRVAVVIEGVDQAGPLPSHHAALLPELASRTGWAVVAVSHQEAGTDWASLGSAIELQPLTDFDTDDVRACLLDATELGTKSVQELEAG